MAKPKDKTLEAVTVWLSAQLGRTVPTDRGPNPIITAVESLCTQRIVSHIKQEDTASGQ